MSIRRISICALVAVLALLALLPPPAQAAGGTVQLTVIIDTVSGRASNGLDSGNNPPDFYAAVTINDATQNSFAQKIVNQSEISPGWKFTRNVPSETGVANVVIGIWDWDGSCNHAFCSNDDEGDANPDPARKQVTLAVNLSTGRWTGTTTERCSEGTGNIGVRVCWFILIGYVRDEFDRTETHGWGNAPIGGYYSLGDPASEFMVNGSQGVMTVPAPNRFARTSLLDVSALDLVANFRVTVQNVSRGGGQLVYFVARRVSPGNDYLARVRFPTDGTVRLQVEREVNYIRRPLGPEKVLQGLRQSPNLSLRLQVEVRGTNPTYVIIFVLQNPCEWWFAGSDSTPALQAPGAVGLRTYLGRNATNAPAVFTFDDFTVSNFGNPTCIP